MYLLSHQGTGQRCALQTETCLTDYNNTAGEKMIYLYNAHRVYEKRTCLKAGLILERGHEPDALYFALGLSCLANSEPGWLSLIGMDLKRLS